MLPAVDVKTAGDMGIKLTYCRSGESNSEQSASNSGQLDP